MNEEILEEYKCINCKTLDSRCKSCDGFGRNLNDKINVEDCYEVQTKKYLGEKENETK